MKTLLVTYDPNQGDCVPDGQIKAYVDRVLEGIHPAFEVLHRTIVGSELIINEFRIRHMRGEVDVSFEFNDTRIAVERTGQLHNWPIGFCDTWDNQLRILLDGRFNK